MHIEEIVALAREAISEEPYAEVVVPFGETIWMMNSLQLERFAELIVRECAEVAGETRWAVPPSQEQIARSIKQHFRLEGWCYNDSI